MLVCDGFNHLLRARVSIYNIWRLYPWPSRWSHYWGFWLAEESTPQSSSTTAPAWGETCHLKFCDIVAILEEKYKRKLSELLQVSFVRLYVLIILLYKAIFTHKFCAFWCRSVEKDSIIEIDGRLTQKHGKPIGRHNVKMPGSSNYSMEISLSKDISECR